ncbi:MAG: hypothetical protein DRO95_03440 [Candidatus Altiarchaeales archaeon]|nr:MAG: hypothetical protein DRO95_03440 [Candidatus Altiarchaeales archaeon]
MQKMKHNVLIVGAGPAGVSAAYFIKHYDEDDQIKVDLVDRLDERRYVQYHEMCGEAVSKYLFDDLSPLRPIGIVEKIKLIKEFWPGDIKIETEARGYIIDRPRFLRYIIKESEKKGCNFRNREVLSVTQNSKKVRVKFRDSSEDYDYVVAADGANSIVRSLMGVVGNTRTYIQYIIDERPERGTLIFYYDEKYSGDYKWVFPYGDKTKVGYPIINDKLFKADGKILKTQSRTIAYGGINKYVYGRILLIGDAACQTNALTKGGIRPGMVAGKLAAKSIVNRNPSQYEQEWLKTDFSSKIFMSGFNKLKKMSNEDLKKHIKPVVDNISAFTQLKCILFYRKYKSLYKAYELSERFGW